MALPVWSHFLFFVFDAGEGVWSWRDMVPEGGGMVLGV